MDDDAPQWQLAVGYGLSQTDLLFGDVEVALRRRAVGVALDRDVGDGFSVSAQLGVAAGGDIRADGVGYTLGIGGYGALSGSYRILDGVGEEPFLVATLTLGASGAPSDGAGERAMFVGTDLRAALTVGKTFWGAFAPYAVVRFFGGPALWELAGERVYGGDRNHYQLGAGLIAMSDTLSASLEVVPLGERNFTVGTSVAF